VEAKYTREFDGIVNMLVCIPITKLVTLQVIKLSEGMSEVSKYGGCLT